MGTIDLTTTTGAQTWTVPADWNNTSNTIEVIASGGGGGTPAGAGSGSGGGGGGYSKITNLALTPGATVNFFGSTGGAANTAGPDAWFNGASLAASSVGAKGGGAGAGNSAGGAGGASASGIGTVKFSGGAGGTGNPTNSGGGGGGAASAAGNGGNGGPGLGGFSTAGGVGGTSGAGLAGGAGGANTGTAGSPGAPGVDLVAAGRGSGSGGGGAGVGVSPGGIQAGGAGGLYGAGGGGGSGDTSGNGAGGVGGQYIIRITYQSTHAFGDSVTASTAATDTAHGYVALLGASLGVAIVNHGISGDMVPDGAAKIYTVTPGLNDKFTLMFGINDERIYGVNATTQAYFRAGLQDHCAYLGTATKQLALSSGAETGVWGATGVLGIGKSSNTNGSTKQWTVSGTTVYLSMLRQDTGTGTYDVQIDGSTVGSFATQSTGLATLNGINYGPRLHRFAGLANTSHTVKVIVTSATGGANQVYAQWVAGNTQTVKPNVYLADVLRATAYTSGGSAANVAAYDVDVAALIAELQADGLSVRAVPVQNLLDLVADMDGAYHPINSGHAKIAAVFLAAMTGSTARSFGAMI